jgi:hypothetical protein
MKALFLVVMFALISGCAILEPLRGESAPKIAEWRDAYCAETDADYRAGLNEDVNSIGVDGNRIDVTCK